jgi:RecA/RadA recombinase
MRRRLGSELAALDGLIDGGIVRGRISEIIGPRGVGRTTIVARFVAATTREAAVRARYELERALDRGGVTANGGARQGVSPATITNWHLMTAASIASFAI